MKMKIIKKNQLAILVIALMLITAGYLNYSTNYNGGETLDTHAPIDNSMDLAALGDAELVNANTAEENKTNNLNEKTEESVEEPKEENNTQTEVNTNESKETVAVNVSSDYFVKSKLERNVMYSQMTTRYQEIITSNSQAQEQKAIAQQEINKINELQNAIMIAENLLTSKGFEENIIFVNGTSISIIIGKNPLAPEEIAQIQNIVSRELKAELENIHISMK
ncbi:MAG: SpoIIIAH-like family protein [Clostridia bacterium]|jgi:stage III sporulation protein AH|nr:SpoIIIAH-like family protein [Clostridia bacterium]